VFCILVLDLVHYIPFSRLKAAFKKVLKHFGIKKKKKKDQIRKKHSNMAKKRTLSMTMEPQFDIQPEGPDQKKQNQPQSVLGSNFFKIYPHVYVNFCNYRNKTKQEFSLSLIPSTQKKNVNWK
jgi:hypothetical protein